MRYQIRLRTSAGDRHISGMQQSHELRNVQGPRDRSQLIDYRLNRKVS